MSKLTPQQLQMIRNCARDDDGYAALVHLFDQHAAQMLDSLQQHEARYRAVVDQQTEFVCRFLPDTTLTFVNEAYCRFHNRRADELVGQKFLLLLAPGTRETVAASIRDYVKNPTLMTYENLVHRRDGEPRHVEWVRRPIFDSDGQLAEIQSVGRDVTEQRQTEAALNRSQKSNRRLLGLWPEGVMITHETIVQYANPAIVRLMGGKSPDDLIGKSIFDLLHPDYHEIIRERIDILGHDQEQVVRRHERYLRLDGSPIDVEISLIPYELDGAPVTITFVQDMTHQKQTEDALHGFQDQLRALHQLSVSLSKARTFDSFCLQAIEEGRVQLGIERLGLWFLSDDWRQISGSYGTDDQGRTVDERGISHPTDDDFGGLRFTENHYLSFDDSVDLTDAQGNLLGKGWNALVGLWNGDKVIGYLSADNLLSKTPASSGQLELLVLYGATLGHLATRIRAEDALRASEETERQFQNQLRVLHEVNMELTSTTSFRDLCQRAVELGHSRLGFDRVSLWFNDEKDPKYLCGSFGIDEHGKLRDEWNQRFIIAGEDTALLASDTSSGNPRARITENTNLLNATCEVVGQGWNAAAAIMDGEHSIGCLYADNLLSQRPPTRYTVELLRLYGATLGHLAVRKWAEEALQQSERRYRAIFEEAGVGICVINAEGRPLSFNPTFQQMLGYSAEELRYVDLGEITYDRDKEETDQHFEQLLTGNVSQYKLEKRYVLKDGSLRWVRINASLFPGNEPGENFVVAIVEDIDEQKRAESQLRDSEARNRALREAIPDLIFLYDAEGRFVDYHKPPEAHLLIPPDEFLNRHFDEVLPPEMAATMRLPFQAVADTGETQVFEYTADVLGQPHFFESRMMKYGEQRVMSIIRDVTERKAAEDQLRESEARFRQIADHVDEVFFIREQATGKQLYTNPAIGNILQRPLQELLASGFSLADYTYPDDVTAVEAFFTSPPPSDKSEMEFRVVRPDGTLRWVWMQIFPIKDEHGRVYRSAGIVKDITERKQMEKQNLELSLQNERVHIIADFVRDASHQFRTPLSVINSKVYLAGKVVEPEERLAHLRGIQEQSENILKLVESLVSMSRLDSDAALSMMPLNLGQMLYALQTRHRSLAADNEVDLTLENIDDLPPVRADVNELYTAVAHLLDNAIRYTPEGGHIALRALHVGSTRIAIEVEDTGSGIPATELPRVFDRFYRGQVAYGTAGFGLGLAMVKKIVERHGGHIEVRSQPGLGSTFTILLPVYIESDKPEQLPLGVVHMS